MVETQGEALPAGTAALEHLTGPSRGTVTWFSGAGIDISLGPDQLIHLSQARPDAPHKDLVARLRQTNGGYEIEAIGERPVWVNGGRIGVHELRHRDMIEFDETGPLSRYRLYREDGPVRATLGDILRDALAYLRVSRQPLVVRALRVLGQILRRLTRQTTILFRLSVVLAIAALAALVWQQGRTSVRLQERVESGATRLESFAGALDRAKQEALTPNDLELLRLELAGRMSSNVERLAALERRSLATGRVIAASKSSVLLLQGAYGFRERASGRMLRHAVDGNGRPLISSRGQPLLTLEGDGPVAERQFTGTGFAVAGAIVTNRHVALPWENDADVELLAGQGLEPILMKFVSYRPGAPAAAEVELLRASDDADLAVLSLKSGADPQPGLKLAEAPPDPGDAVIVMGYPTGLRSILAQSGAAFIEELQKAEDTDFWSVAARLAQKGHILPLASRGIVGQVTDATIVYDAETTHGGSGGPVLNIDGAVVAVNAAILPEFGGSNLGVPVAKVRALLASAGLI